MTKQNKLLIVLIALLLIANLIVMFRKRTSSSVGYDDRAFSVQDTSSITSIQIGDLELKRENGWKINGQVADPAFVDHLLNVMLRVRVKKPAGEVQEGMRITINDGESFTFSSNATKTKTIFSNQDGAYEVEIPGFTDYVGGIFELNADQWRDRLILNGSWRTIQKLELDYVTSDEQDFSIQFEKNFFKVSGISAIDTTILINYLNQFQYFQANERISSGRMQTMDSLRETPPLATLTIEDINYKEVQKLKIFPRRAEDGFHLFLDQNDEMVAVDQRRSNQILLKKRDFQFDQ